jgi:hypothetical protein
MPSELFSAIVSVIFIFYFILFYFVSYIYRLIIGILCFSGKEVEFLSETHDLCVGGDCFEMLQQTSAHLLVIPYVKVLIDA